MLSNYLLPDILQYIFNEYISHRPEELKILEHIINFKFNTDKYKQNLAYEDTNSDCDVFNIYIDEELYFREYIFKRI
jgi:hypothetical protein